jgi:hypothetical protein
LLSLAWSYSAGQDGRSALPQAGDRGMLTRERLNEDEMVCFETLSKEAFMSYPDSLATVRAQLSSPEPVRGVVTEVDEEYSRFVVAIPQSRD